MTGEPLKFVPSDRYTAELYQKHGLGSGVEDFAAIEPKATELLKNIRTALTGAELVLGHHVDAKNKNIAQILYTPGLSPEDKFGLLLMAKQAEIEAKG